MIYFCVSVLAVLGAFNVHTVGPRYITCRIYGNKDADVEVLTVK